MNVESPVELQDMHGLWRRSWSRTPTTYDDSTHVLRMQAADLHVDIRLPLDLIELKAAQSLSTLDSTQLRSLASAEGFAGTTKVSDCVCTWSRRINLRGPLKGPDTGFLRHTPDGLLETGIHSSYEELWKSLDDEIPQQRMMSDKHGRTLILLWTKSRFAMGRGWHERTIHNRSLLEHVDFALGRYDQTALARAFDQEFCFGHIADGQGIIEHSTQPMRCGTPAFDVSALSANSRFIDFTVTDFFGETSMVEFRLPMRRVAMA